METTIITTNNGNFQSAHNGQSANQQTITSMEIAEITGKNHSDVLRAIRKMEPAWEKEHKSKFALKLRLVETGCGAHKKSPYYEMNRTESLFIATKFNDQARARLVIRWAELEEQRMMQQPQPQTTDVQANPSNLPADPSQLTRKQLLLMALEAEEENERLKAEKESLSAEKENLQNEKQELEAKTFSLMIEQGRKDEKIQQLEESVGYLKLIMSDNTSVTVSQIAQDYGMSAVAFNNLLKGLRIQRAVGGQWILYSEFLNMGYVTNRMIPIHHAGRPDTFKPLTTWTQNGRKFLYERLKKHGVLPLIERNVPVTTSPQKGGTTC